MKTRMGKGLCFFAVLMAFFMFASLSPACAGNNSGDDGIVINGSIHHNDVTLGGSGGNATATGGNANVDFHPEFDIKNINNVHNNLHNTNNNSVNNENRNTNTNNNTNKAESSSFSMSNSNADAKATVLNSGNSSSNSAVIGSGNSCVSTKVEGDTNVNLQNTKVEGDTNVNLQGNVQSTKVEGDTTIVEGNTLNQTFEAPEIPRNFANGVEMNYAPMPTYTGPDAVNSNVVDLRNQLDYKHVFTRAELSKMSKKADVNVRDNTTAEKAPAADRKRKDRAIPIFLGTPTTRIESLGMITVVADDFETTTLEVMAIAALHGLDINADAMYVMAYGGDKMVESSGWGLGINSSAATINGNSDLSTVTSGGTGYSSGKAGLKTQPWVHVHMVRFAPEMK